MYSRGHALVSLVVGLAIVAVTSPPVHPAIVVAVVLAVGVGIDVDHFVVAAGLTGSTKNLRRVLRDPTLVVRDQAAIFDEGDLTEEQRLLSHVVIAGAAVASLWFVSRYWAMVVAVTLYAHVLADLVADVRGELAAGEGDRSA